MQLARALQATAMVTGILALAHTRRARADTDEPPVRPPLVLAPAQPPPRPAPDQDAEPEPGPAEPPPPRSPWRFSLSVGLGDLVIDQARTGCAKCTGSPAFESYLGIGREVVPGVTVGFQLQIQGELVTGYPNDGADLSNVIGFLYGQYAMTDELDVIGGIGLAKASYNYTVEMSGVFGNFSENESDRVGGGPAVLGAVRYRLVRTRYVDLGLEARATVTYLGAAGTVPGVSIDVVGGRF